MAAIFGQRELRRREALGFLWVPGLVPQRVGFGFVTALIDITRIALAVGGAWNTGVDLAFG